MQFITCFSRVRATRIVLSGALFGAAVIALAQDAPPNQLEPVQAPVSVQHAGPRSFGTASSGVAESEWTPQERQLVDRYRTMFAAQGMPFTQQQGEQMVLALRQQVARMTGSIAAMQMLGQQAGGGLPPPASATPSPVAQSTSSEAQLAGAIAALGPKPGQVLVEQRRDGFLLNGEPVLDPEGRIELYAWDAVSGLVTYAVSSSRGITVKTVGAGDPSKVVVIAQGTRNRGGYEFTTVSGQHLNGETFSVQSNGFLVGRSTSGFVYEAGRGIRTIAVPPGWVLAPLQRGNVGATQVVLLEKDIPPSAKGDELQQMIGHMQSIGSLLGVTKKEDYALYDTRARKLYPLNISLEGKDRTFYAQCRQVKWWLQNCDKWATFDALWQQDGDRNKSHYYWRVDWAATPDGPVAAVLEGGLSDLSLIDFRSGRKVLALQRTLGIASWQLTQRGDGVLALHAKLGFEDKDVSDVSSVLAQP